MILTIARRTARHEKHRSTCPFSLIRFTTPLNPEVCMGIRYTNGFDERRVTQNSGACTDISGSSQAFEILDAAVLDEGAPDPDEQTTWGEESEGDDGEGGREGGRVCPSGKKFALKLQLGILGQESMLSTRSPVSLPLFITP